MNRRALLCTIFAVLAATAHAQGPIGAASGSTAFCLYELPSDDAGKRRWLNLGIVQYVEAGRNEVSIYYGGGHFGSGHVARIPTSGPADTQAVMERLKQAAAACR